MYSALPVATVKTKNTEKFCYIVDLFREHIVCPEIHNYEKADIVYHEVIEPPQTLANLLLKPVGYYC